MPRSSARAANGPAPATRPWQDLVFYYTIRAAFRVLAIPMFRFRTEGRTHVPLEGPGVVVAPHRSWLDPLCVGAACPRPVRFLIIENVYHWPWARWFYRRMGSMPIKTGGAGSIAALRTALRILRDGELVGIFPEGRVVSGGDFGDVHPGAAMLAVRAQAPVIPMIIPGSAHAWPHRKLPRPAAVRVRVGEPIQPPAERSREAVDELRHRIERSLRELAAEEGLH